MALAPADVSWSESDLTTVVAVLALGVGTAANTTIFRLMDALLLRHMPGVKAGGELAVFERWQAGQFLGNLGYPDYRDYRDRMKAFSGVAAEAGARVSFSIAGATERVATALVSGNYSMVLPRCRAVARGCRRK